jgi:hypothetical protein
LAAPCAVEPKEPASAASTGQRQQELTASAAREAVGAAVGTARAVVKFQQRNPSGRRLVTLRLRRVDLLSLTEIDQLRQVFTAQLYVTFCIPGGAEDPCLCSELHKEKPAFPIGPDGKPTFRPPAGWYLNQLDFSNAVDVRLIDKAIMQSGSDLVLSARYQGTFSEALELERFPFDAQPLTISMVVNCRESGPVPVAIELDDLVAKSVDPRKSFALYQEWHLADLICVRVGRTSADIADRVFPQISFSFFVARRPGFVLTNVALPTLLISTLSFVPFCLDPMDYIADRFALLFALVLTTVTFKSIISTMVPAIAYLTWVDKYVLASSLCVFASMLISALVFVVPSPDPRRTDNIACACLGVVWLCAQLYYGAQAIRAVQKKRDILAQLSSDIGDASSGTPAHLPRAPACLRARSSSPFRRLNQGGLSISLQCPLPATAPTNPHGRFVPVRGDPCALHIAHEAQPHRQATPQKLAWGGQALCWRQRVRQSTGVAPQRQPQAELDWRRWQRCSEGGRARQRQCDREQLHDHATAWGGGGGE